MRYMDVVKAAAMALPVLGATACSAATVNGSTVNSCGQASGDSPGVGHSFNGKVYNEDYNFSVSIPKGLTGWSGVSESAPFHGFTVFLGNDRKSCVVLEIHIRVDDDDSPQRPPSALSRSFGGAKGWESKARGKVDGMDIINTVTDFSYMKNDFTADGFVKFIAPYEDEKKYEYFYIEIIESLAFGRGAKKL